MDNDKIRKLDKDELEMVTGGKVSDFIPGFRFFTENDEIQNTNNVNNISPNLKKNRPVTIKT